MREEAHPGGNALYIKGGLWNQAMPRSSGASGAEHVLQPLVPVFFKSKVARFLHKVSPRWQGHGANTCICPDSSSILNFPQKKGKKNIFTKMTKVACSVDKPCWLFTLSNKCMYVIFFFFFYKLLVTGWIDYVLNYYEGFWWCFFYQVSLMPVNLLEAQKS